jgi:hypothetical protein
MRLEMTMQMEELKSGATPTGGAPTGTNRNTTQQHYQYHNQPTNYYESLLLDKLHDMVPIMPRGRELSKLEIINYVIDYIRQLREMVVDEEMAQQA